MNIGYSSKQINISILFLLALSYLFIRPIWTFMNLYDIIPFYNFYLILIPLLYLYVLSFIYRLREYRQIRLTTFIGTGLIICIILIQLMSFPWVKSYSDKALDIYTATIYNTILITVVMWLIGINYTKILQLVLKNKYLKNSILIMYCLYVFWILYGIYLNINNISNILSIQVFDLQSQYLSMSSTFAICSILISGFIKKTSHYLLFHLMAATLIFSLVSRSGFVFYVVTALVLIVIKLIKEKKRKSIILLLTVSIFFSINTSLFKDLSFELENSDNRIIYTLFNRSIEDDNSFVLRQNFMDHGLEDIKDNWFLGKFMSDVERTGESGTYMHNWLSFYLSYGLIPFIAFILLAIFLFIKTIKSLIYNYNHIVLMSLGLLLFTLLNIVFTKSFQYVEIWLALGIATNCLWERNYNGEKYNKYLIHE